MSTFRILTFTNERLSTAVPLKSGKFLQVFPEHTEFPSVDVWLASWKSKDNTVRMVETVNTKPERTYKGPSPAQARLRREMAEFIELLETEKYIKSLTFTSNDTVVVQLEDAVYTIHRSLDFLWPPIIHKGDELINVYDAEYSPAFTSTKWFLMLMTQA